VHQILSLKMLMFHMTRFAYTSIASNIIYMTTLLLNYPEEVRTNRCFQRDLAYVLVLRNHDGLKMRITVQLVSISVFFVSSMHPDL